MTAWSRPPTQITEGRTPPLLRIELSSKVQGLFALAGWDTTLPDDINVLIDIF